MKLILPTNIEYHSNSDNDFSESAQIQDYENSSSKFYKEHSAADVGDLKERQRRWIESKFFDRNEDECQLFMENNFDNVFKAFTFDNDTKSIDSKEQSGKLKSDDKHAHEFNRDDLEAESESVSLHDSIYTDKGSEAGLKENEKLSDSVPSSKSHSPFWKRVDMRQKKVIRGLCGLTKEYFKTMISKKNTKDEMFKVWDDFLLSHFPELYHSSRLVLLGHISVMCLSWKFSEKVNS